MKAMIFAAGLGSRLKPLTDETPKALLPVGGKPMLEHIILKLKAAGFTHLVINIHHLGEQIIEFLTSKSHFGLHIDISDERNYLMDTGGGIKQAQSFLKGDEPFLVHNVDIFSNIDLEALYRHHLTSDALATLVVSHRQTARRLLFGQKKDHRLYGWRNRNTGEVRSHYPQFDPSEEWTGKFSIINFYLSVCAKAPICPYVQDGLRLIDIGKPEALAEADTWLRDNGLL